MESYGERRTELQTLTALEAVLFFQKCCPCDDAVGSGFSVLPPLGVICQGGDWILLLETPFRDFAYVVVDASIRLVVQTVSIAPTECDLGELHYDKSCSCGKKL